MSQPSIRKRLMLGCGLAVSIMLPIGLSLIARSLRLMLEEDLKARLIESSLILAKSSELEPTGVVYEWHEALESGSDTSVPGYFQFWDLKSGKSVMSPALENQNLEFFHGKPNVPVIREIHLPDGRPALAAGLLHWPFLDDEGTREMERSGTALAPVEFPQVLVCAHETASLGRILARIRWQFVQFGAAILLVIWIAIAIVIRRSLAPLRKLAAELEERAHSGSPPAPVMPRDTPRELAGLTGIFLETLGKAELARDRERAFALSAAHELRTPIAGIRSTLEQALNKPRGAEELSRRMASALEIAEDMSGTINSLMSLARARGGLDRVRCEPFDVSGAFRDLHAREAQRLSTAGIYCEIQTSPEPIPAHQDPELFKMAIMIFFDNLVRHAPWNSMASASVKGAGENFIIRFENDAPRLSREDLEKIARPFQRGNRTTGSEGAGLGLSLADEVIRLLGGSLELHLEEETSPRLVQTISIPARHPGPPSGRH